MIEIGLKKLANINIRYDNRGAISLAENPILYTRTKHIDMWQAIRENKLCLKHVPTADMAADILTKILPKFKHYKYIEFLGLK